MVDVNETLFIQEAGNWRQPYLDYLQHQLLPPNRTDVAKIKTKSSGFFVEEGTLFRKGLNQAPLRCIGAEEINTIIREVHSGECGEYQGDSRLAKQVIDLGYYWLTMETNSLSLVRRCKACQIHRKRIHAPAVELHSLATP